MILGNLNDLVKRLGNVSLTYACALKKAAGYSGTRHFDIEAVVAWKRRNKGWTVTKVYPRKQSPQHTPKGLSVATAGKSGGRE